MLWPETYPGNAGGHNVERWYGHPVDGEDPADSARLGLGRSAGNPRHVRYGDLTDVPGEIFVALTRRARTPR